MLADEFVKTPAVFWHTALPPGTPGWGREAKAAMSRNYRRTVHVVGPVQELPVPSARVGLDATWRDHLGLPVARLSGHAHRDDRLVAEMLVERALEWVGASGAVRSWACPSPRAVPALSAGQHQAGTCRMGDHPATSACRPDGALHGCPNVVLADTSVHVTNGGVNPALTAMALAWRAASLLVDRA